MLNFNLTPTHELLTTFFCSPPWTNWAYKIFVNNIVILFLSNNIPFTHLHRDFGLWFRCGVPFCFLYGFDEFRTLLLVVKLQLTILELFLCHTCLISFWKRILIEWNTLNIVYIKTHTQWNTFFSKQFFQTFFCKHSRDYYKFFSKGANSHQHKWMFWSLGDWSCWKKMRVFLNLHFVNQNRVLRN